MRHPGAASPGVGRYGTAVGERGEGRGLGLALERRATSWRHGRCPRDRTTRQRFARAVLRQHVYPHREMSNRAPCCGARTSSAKKPIGRSGPPSPHARALSPRRHPASLRHPWHKPADRRRHPPACPPATPLARPRQPPAQALGDRSPCPAVFQQRSTTSAVAARHRVHNQVRSLVRCLPVKRSRSRARLQPAASKGPDARQRTSPDVRWQAPHPCTRQHLAR